MLEEGLMIMAIGANGVDLSVLNKKWALCVSRGMRRQHKLGMIATVKNNAGAALVFQGMCGNGDQAI